MTLTEMAFVSSLLALRCCEASLLVGLADLPEPEATMALTSIVYRSLLLAACLPVAVR